MTDRCPNCGAPAGKAHVCRYRFDKPSPRRPQPLTDDFHVDKKSGRPKPGPQPHRVAQIREEVAKVVAKAKMRKSGKLPPAHPDCERCEAYKKQQREVMRARRSEP